MAPIEWYSFTGYHAAAFMAGAGFQAIDCQASLRQCARTGIGCSAMVFAGHVAYKSYNRSFGVNEEALQLRRFETSRSELGRDLKHSFEALCLLKEEHRGIVNPTYSHKASLAQELYAQRCSARHLEERATKMTNEAADCERKLYKLNKEFALFFQRGQSALLETRTFPPRHIFTMTPNEWYSFAGYHAAMFIGATSLPAMFPAILTWRSCARVGLGCTVMLFSWHIANKSWEFSDSQVVVGFMSETGRDLSHALETLCVLQEQAHIMGMDMDTPTDKLKQEFTAQRRGFRTLEERVKTMTKEAADYNQKCYKLEQELGYLNWSFR